MNTPDIINIQHTINDLRSNSDQFSKDFVTLLNKQHRTHQASVIKNIQTILKLYAETATCDQRNEAAVDFAQQVSEIDTYISYI